MASDGLDREVLAAYGDTAPPAWPRPPSEARERADSEAFHREQEPDLAAIKYWLNRDD